MDKETKFQIEVIKEQARILWATTIVSWFTRLKYKLYKPFRDLRDTLVGKLVQFYEKYQARKGAKEYQLFVGMKRAVEDCVVLYPEKKLKLEALKFFSCAELGTNLRWALKDYFKTHTDPERYGEVMEEAFRKGASPPPDSFTHSGSVLSYDSATPPISVTRNIRNPDVQKKTANNQKMWEYKKCHKGRTPREDAIKNLKAKILHLEGVLAGSIPKATVRVEWQEEDLANIAKFKEKLAKLEASDEFYDWKA